MDQSTKRVAKMVVDEVSAVMFVASFLSNPMHPPSNPLLLLSIVEFHRLVRFSYRPSFAHYPRIISSLNGDMHYSLHYIVHCL